MEEPRGWFLSSSCHKKLSTHSRGRPNRTSVLPSLPSSACNVQVAHISRFPGHLLKGLSSSLQSVHAAMMHSLFTIFRTLLVLNFGCLIVLILQNELKSLKSLKVKIPVRVRLELDHELMLKLCENMFRSYSWIQDYETVLSTLEIGFLIWHQLVRTLAI